MAGGEKEVRFADAEMEADYRRLSSSESVEDKRLFRVLTRIRAAVAQRYQEGTSATGNTLSLDLGLDGTVLYTVTDDGVLILDVL